MSELLEGIYRILWATLFCPAHIGLLGGSFLSFNSGNQTCRKLFCPPQNNQRDFLKYDMSDALEISGEIQNCSTFVAITETALNVTLAKALGSVAFLKEAEAKCIEFANLLAD